MDGALSFLAEQEGVKGDATHITNASRQRAQLFAFVLALTEHVWQRDGGVRLLLLDDPQTLFDDDNKSLLARGIVSIAHADTGFFPIVLTIDRVFAEYISREGHRRSDVPLSRKVSRWELQGRFGDDSSASLLAHQNQLDVARSAWKDGKTDTARIGIFCRIGRVFLEQTLRDLLREADRPIADLPTLQPLRERLTALVKDVRVVQSGAPFKSLLALLPGDSNEHEVLRDALNWSCHFQADELEALHAEAIDTMLDRFLPCREECFDLLLNWQAATSSSEIAPTPANENLLPAIPVPRMHIAVVGYLAASDGETEPADVEAGVDQQLDLDPTLHTTFAVGAAANWLPPLIASDTALITGPLEGDVRPKDLVLVWDKGVGRAFVGWGKVERERRRIILSGFPGRAGFHKVFPLADVELRQVVACMFGAAPGARRPCEPRDLTGILERRWVRALEITAGDSAEPLLYTGDMALVGKPINLRELDRHPAPAFALRLSDGTQVLKRLNREPQGDRDSPVRQLLPVGERGAGRVVSVGRGAPSWLPTIEAAYPLIGSWRSR
jgi:hypothetical protein